MRIHFASSVHGCRAGYPLAVSLLALTAGVAARAAGQDTTATEQRFCFKPQPAPRCAAGLLVEFNAVTPVLGSHNYQPPYTDRHPRLTFLSAEFGLLANRGERSAFGASLGLGVDEAFTTFVIRPRYHRWLRPDLSVEVAPTLYLTAGPASPYYKLPGPGVGLRLAVSTHESMGASLEPRRFGDTSTMLAGANLRSGMGVGAILLAGVGVIVALASL